MDVVLDELLPVVLIELFERVKLRVIEFLFIQFNRADVIKTITLLVSISKLLIQF